MTKFKYPDQRSKKFIFIPFCLICQAFQARGIVRFGYSSTIKPVVEEILRHDVNIIQMPCPESQLGGTDKGLKREPRGIQQYEKSPEFIKICDIASSDVVKQMKAIIANDFEIVGVLGMEYSPSCSVRLQYSHKGTIHRPGIFIEMLMKKLEDEKINIPFVGINRRGIKASVDRINKLFEEYNVR